jgi:hypothetical protein
VVLSTHDELARLWLPWCVARNDRSVPIVHAPAEHPSALQLRMTDLDDPMFQRALAWQRLDTETSWERIVHRAQEFERRAHAGERILVGPDPAKPTQDPAVYEFDGLQMLHEACHRVSALYVSGLDSFRLELQVEPLGWPAYRPSALRQR